MEAIRNFRLSQCTPSLKVLVTCLVVTLGIGYAVSLLQVNNRGSFDRKKTELHFRGSAEEGEGIYVPQSDPTLISVAHVHTFSQPVVLGVMGLLFALTGLSQAAKIFWIIFSFAGSVAMNASPWLIRDLSPAIVPLLYFGGLAMTGTFLVMAVLILYETWRGGHGEDVR